MRSHDLNGTIIYNGKSSADLGVIVNKLPVIRKPKRKGSTTSIPGRHGKIAREENGAFENYVQPYEISITDTNRGISAIARDLAAWLLNTRDYIRLEDSFESDVYRMARFEGPFDIEPIMEDDGKTVIEFDCQPQRYLKSGEQEITLTEAQQTIYNPTAFAAAPLIRVDIDASLYPPPEDPLEIVTYGDGGDYAWTWTFNKAIANKQSGANAHKVVDHGADSKVSQWIDVEGYEKAVVTAQCYWVVTWPAETGHLTDYYGNYYGTCYTFLDVDGNPTTGIYGTQKMQNVEVAIPRNAKYLVIATAWDSEYDRYPITPSVTLYPAPASNEKPGAFSINGTTADIVFTDRSTIYLDCKAHNAYFADGSNANAAISFTDNERPYATFPELDPGENLVSIDGTGVTATIKPRWWTL